MNIIDLIQNLKESHDNIISPISKKFKLPLTSVDILLFLHDHPDALTASDIVKTLQLKANIVSFNVDKLVSEGYLVREHVSSDRRKINLICTEKASPIIECGVSARENFIKKIFDGLSEDDLCRMRYHHEIILENLNKLAQKNK